MAEQTQQDNTVVVTGVGLVTALGLDASSTWEAIATGRSGLGPMPALEQRPQPDKGGGQAPDLPGDLHADLPREARYLRYAIDQALTEAGLGADLHVDSARCGLMFGTTLHGLRAAGRYFRNNDLSEFGSFLATSTLNLAAGHLPVSGPAWTTCSACSSGLGAMAMAMTLLRRGDLDLVIAGGYDPVSEYAYAGFNSLRLVSDAPPRPFCADRSGLKLGEGYGVLILERAADAAARGATPRRALLGYGESCDAHHLTQPHPEGDGAARAMEAALKSAGVDAEQIDLIDAHATATPNNDGGEYAAMLRVFGDRLSDVPVVSFKSHLGHTLGGAGAVELILAIEAAERQLAPPTAHVTQDDVEFAPLKLITGAPEPRPIVRTLSSAFGFGGANTCLVAASPTDTAPADGEKTSPVLISGVGVLAPGAVGNAAFVERLGDAEAWARGVGGDVDPADLAPHLNARRTRRVSECVKLVLAATSIAFEHAGIEDRAAFADGAHAVLGTTHGAAGYSEDYYRQVVAEGIDAANPMWFAEGVPNSISAHVSLSLKLTGSSQTIVGSRTAGLDALGLAAARIASGTWDRAIVAVGDECSALANEAYGACGMLARRDASDGFGPATPFGHESGFAPGSGAACLVLESANEVSRRGGTPLAVVEACASAWGRPDDPRSAIEAATACLERVGRPDHVVGSAQSTRLDRIEAVALAAGGARVASSIYGHIAEAFSLMPMAGLAAWLLDGKMPALVGGGLEGAVRSAGGSETPETIGVLCTDWTGPASACRVRRI